MVPLGDLNGGFSNSCTSSTKAYSLITPSIQMNANNMKKNREIDKRHGYPKLTVSTEKENGLYLGKQIV